MDYLEAEAKISYSIVNRTSIVNVNTFAPTSQPYFMNLYYVTVSCHCLNLISLNYLYDTEPLATYQYAASVSNYLWAHRKTVTVIPVVLEL
jgi:hypothetical protein